MMHKRGFTLIELLVVIAIIAILAAILFPVFTTAKEKGRQSTCASNVRQISMALMSYCEDNGNGLPENAKNQYTTGFQHPERWFSSALMKYLKNDKVWDCPSAKNEPGCYHSAAGRDYGMASTFRLCKITGIMAPGKTPIIADSLYNFFFSDQNVYDYPGSYTDCGPNRVHTGKGKTGTVNFTLGQATFAFLDGHVRTTYEVVIDGPYNRSLGKYEWRLATSLPSH